MAAKIGLFLLLTSILLVISRGVVGEPPPVGFQCDTSSETGQRAIITRVIDGDTVALSNGDRVRYIGVDTPERGEPLYKEATDFNRNLVESREVRLTRDISERDRYGRLLRYVYVDDILVNAELVREGYAREFEYKPDVRFRDCFVALEKEPKKQKRGIWAR